jgi:hypothetical protein
MIEFAEFEEFRYSEPQWSELKAVVRGARLDVDQITLQVTRRTMEFAASAYLPQRTINRQRLSRDELKVLRKDAENLRARIASALAVHINIKNVGPHSYPRRRSRHAGRDPRILR